MRFQLSKILGSFVPVVVLICFQSHIAYAGHDTLNIRSTSVKWADTDNRTKLLESVPRWDENVINSVFAVYRDSEHNELPKTSNARQYDIEFINSVWGPLNNPFAKQPRPAKVFILFANSSDYYMSPLIKNNSDGNYYVLVKKDTRPLLLNDWVTNIMISHPGKELRFNVCNGYADKPDDSCMSKSYQSETSDAIGKRMTTIKSDLVFRETSPSAHRDMREDWRVKAQGEKRSVRHSGGNIYTESVSWTDSDAKAALLNQVTSWPDFKTIQDNFEKIRDIRYFDDQRQHGFARRISWLYPDDGCWTRATAVIKDLFGPLHNSLNKYPRPSKVFAFGNLCAKTDNSPNGYVSWWYHTAPVIKDAQTHITYVLDPAVEPHKPLTLDQWMSAITAKSQPCNMRSSVDLFNICNGYGTRPYSRCESSFQIEEYEDIVQPEYQNVERQRQSQLRRDANAVLGDAPPWIN